MNREIKFRGKDLVTGEWLYGHYMPPFFEGASSFIWVPENCNDHWEYLNSQVITDTVGQYTGLKDKNGVEIYEGDIMNDPTSKIFGLVEWNNILTQFQLSWQNMPTTVDIFFMVKNGSLVIGNIHDNPELINRKEKK